MNILYDILNQTIQFFKNTIGSLTMWELVLLVVFALLVSGYLFVRFLHYRKWLRVDLGKHTWLIK